MIVLDTNVVSELMKLTPDVAVRDWFLNLGEDPVATTAVTVAEIEFGLQRLPHGRRKSTLSARFEAVVGPLTVLPLDEAAAREAGRIRASREAAGRSSPSSDMMIAGIAAAVGAVLATRNVKDFASATLQVVDPWIGKP